MDLTSKQRAQLRGLANGIDTIVQIGKDGMGENLLKQANDALEARELIKCQVLDAAMLTTREASEQMAKLTRSEVVQVIGTKFVLYRQTHRKDKKRIVLVTSKRPRTTPQT
ncbi:MAG: ribosome assembly RNA-binding protein YhbY [Evtepia sp.]